jgi:hypothetical protein
MAKVHRYAHREPMVDVLRWDGGDLNFQVMSKWTDGRVRKSGTDLILQEPGNTARVELGDYIVCKNPVSYYTYTAEQLEDAYVEIVETSQAV